jgi:hypothetical protein
MRLEDYQKISFSKFNGIYDRGDSDSVPPDHAIDCGNVLLRDPGNVRQRPGSKLSFTLTHRHPTCVNQFLATGNGGAFFVTMDGFGNMYKESGSASTLIWPPAGEFVSDQGYMDFAGLNMFGRTYFNIIRRFTGVGAFTESIKVWDGINPVRDAAGLPPSYLGNPPVGVPPSNGPSDFYTVPRTGGVVSLGVHRVAVSYETNTGFITRPGPIWNLATNNKLIYTQSFSDGTNYLLANNIPIAQSYQKIVARHLLMTKGDELQYFFVPNGRIPDNITTSWNINCTDNELIVDASYLFDVLDTIPGGYDDGGLTKYHGRLFVWGGEADLVRVSYAGDTETFSDVTGYVQLPSESNGNYVRGSFSLRDTLYFTKGVGIFATQDLSGDEPANWPVTIIDGSAGSWSSGISTITTSQAGLPISDAVLLADIEGLHLFNGGIVTPPLTWKIDDVWKQITGSKSSVVMQQITVVIDPFDHLIYIINPYASVPGLNLLVGDFSEGMDSQNIKWTRWYIGSIIGKSISLVSTSDIDGTQSYCPRIATTDNRILKFSPELTQDLGLDFYGVYRFAYTPIEVGSLNIFRGFRVRAKGTGILIPYVYTQDDHYETINTPGTISLVTSPVQDYFREMNIMNEKISLVFQSPNFTVNRVDLFGTVKLKSRPA